MSHYGIFFLYASTYTDHSYFFSPHSLSVVSCLESSRALGRLVILRRCIRVLCCLFFLKKASREHLLHWTTLFPLVLEWYCINWDCLCTVATDFVWKGRGPSFSNYAVQVRELAMVIYLDWKLWWRYPELTSAQCATWALVIMTTTHSGSHLW